MVEPIRVKGTVRPTHPGRSGPETPAMGLLDAVLESYGETLPPAPDDAQALLDAVEAFRVEFRTVLETLLRIMLEEVAWRLDQRGHHAWIVEESAEVAGSSGRDAITLCMLPIGYDPATDEASMLTFLAQPDDQAVIVLEHIGGTEHRDLPIGTFSPSQLTEENVAALGSELVRRSFTAYPPMPSKESEDPSIARDQPAAADADA